ncbi:hypothetical protein CALVIDRAFT_361239 [Calocera viscosa TUFC12733]|uniref:DUF6533 domain-containing protein n=1 Tax=Calocera viscosa (strain TUFC12733) TaxID=1330018 RepID=A0A167H6Q9_CALVF|nr:hypothetical protein CALVIDRAFT_361239 [Calocera viscosa TUFC12733]
MCPAPLMTGPWSRGRRFCNHGQRSYKLNCVCSPLHVRTIRLVCLPAARLLHPTLAGPTTKPLLLPVRWQVSRNKRDPHSPVVVATYAQVASAALLSHDILLTLQREIRLVWRWGTWGSASILYLLTRYGTWIQCCLTLVPLVDYRLDGAQCMPWTMFKQLTIPIVMALVEATLTLRVLALYGNNRTMRACLWLWYLLNITTMFTLTGLNLQTSVSLPSPAPPTLGCILNNKYSYLWELYVPALVFETTVAGLTLLKPVQLKWILSNSNTPLLYVLVRDGFFYFFVVFVLMLANLTICLVMSTTGPHRLASTSPPSWPSGYSSIFGKRRTGQV